MNTVINTANYAEANTLKLDILSPERRLVEGAMVEAVTFFSSEGEIQILPGHAPMLGMLETGPFRYQVPGKEAVEGLISTGFFEISGNSIRLMAETIECDLEKNF